MKTSPVFMVQIVSVSEENVRDKVGDLFWLDLEWGQSWSEGCGYLPVVPWGEPKTRTGFCRDNRVLVDPDDCEMTLLGWTAPDDSEPDRLFLTATAPRVSCTQKEKP